MEITEIQNKLPELHSLRIERNTLKQQADALLETIKNTNPEIFNRLAEVTEQLRELDLDLRIAAVKQFESDPAAGKQICAGVDIKTNKDYIFNPADALEWCEENAKVCIIKSLDDKAFKDVCKSDRLRPAFVTVKEVPSATIATDLSKIVAQLVEASGNSDEQAQA